MDKKLYKEFFWGSQYDIGALEEHFEKMAERGLVLAAVKGAVYSYERRKPVRLRFQVDCFDGGSSFDTKAEKGTLEYIDYCEQAGWHYICTEGRLQFFCTEDTEAVPIQTDSGMAFKSVVRNTLKANWIQWFLLPLLYFFTIFTFFSRKGYFGFLDKTADGMWQTVFLVYIAYIAVAAVSVARFLIFFFRNRGRAREGRELLYFSGRGTKAYGRIIAAAAFLILTGLMAGMLWAGCSAKMAVITAVIYGSMALVVFITFKVCYGRKASRRRNIVFTVIISAGVSYLFMFVVILWSFMSVGSSKITVNDTTYYYSSDELPVTIKELGAEAEGEYLYEETSAIVKRGFLAKLYEYDDAYVSGEGESLCFLDIDIYRTKSGRLMDKYEEYVRDMAESGLEEIEYGGKGNCRVYKFNIVSFWRYLRFEDCQVLIKCSWELTGAQLEQLIEAYGL